MLEADLRRHFINNWYPNAVDISGALYSVNKLNVKSALEMSTIFRLRWLFNIGDRYILLVPGSWNCHFNRFGHQHRPVTHNTFNIVFLVSSSLYANATLSHYKSDKRKISKKFNIKWSNYWTQMQWFLFDEFTIRTIRSVSTPTRSPHGTILKNHNPRIKNSCISKNQFCWNVKKENRKTNVRQVFMRYWYPKPQPLEIAFREKIL